jgi:hypothetical protein
MNSSVQVVSDPEAGRYPFRRANADLRREPRKLAFRRTDHRPEPKALE